MALGGGLAMDISRRRFLHLSALAGGAFAMGQLPDRVSSLTGMIPSAYGAEPIKIGIIDPLSSPYKTSSIHDVHGAPVALKSEGGEVVANGTTPFGTTDFTAALTDAKAAKPNAVILNLYGWDLVNALKAYTKLEMAKEKIGVGGMIGGEQIGRPLGYANNAGVWGLIWDPKINTESSRRFIQGVIDKYNHTPTSRCYLGYAAMMQILEAVRRAGTTDTAAVIKSLEGHEFDGLKEGRSFFRAWDHQHVQDVLVGQAYGKELGLGHYQILATVPGDAVAGSREQNACRL